MKFCINLEQSPQNNIYRLQKDESWELCKNPKIINPNDFIAEDKDTIINLQTHDRIILIGDQQHIINDSGGFYNDGFLFYTVYGFREAYPNPPVQKQLESILINGNDYKNNTLILDTEGIFKLIDEEPAYRDPNIVLQFAGFDANNGYVGPSIEDDDFENDMLKYFSTAMHFWRNHLINKELHISEEQNNLETIDDLLDIYDELLEIEIKFNSYSI